MTSNPLAKRILLSLGVLGALGAIAGLATYATFSSTTSVSNQVSSGVMSIALGTTGASTNRLNINASGVAPGDTIQRAVDLNIGSTNSTGILSNVKLTTSASPSSLLDTDTGNGLQMTIERCVSTAWTESGTAPAYTYTCPGGGGDTQTVVASRPVIGSALTMNNLGLTPATSNHLRVTLSLPSGADDTFQNLSSTLTYAFSGTQRAGTDK